MPSKFEKEGFRVGAEYDRRRKLPAEKHDEIRLKYQSGSYSQRQLAREYGVSRRLITFILDPMKQQRSNELRDHKKYYNREKHNEYMRTHRQHVKKIFQETEKEVK